MATAPLMGKVHCCDFWVLASIIGMMVMMVMMVISWRRSHNCPQLQHGSLRSLGQQSKHQNCYHKVPARLLLAFRVSAQIPARFGWLSDSILLETASICQHLLANSPLRGFALAQREEIGATSGKKMLSPCRGGMISRRFQSMETYGLCQKLSQWINPIMLAIPNVLTNDDTLTARWNKQPQTASGAAQFHYFWHKRFNISNTESGRRRAQAKRQPVCNMVDRLHGLVWATSVKSAFGNI